MHLQQAELSQPIYDQPEPTEQLAESLEPYVPDWRVTALQSEQEDPAVIEQAFTSIVTEYQSSMIDYARHMLGSDAAEDVVQDAFLGAFRRIGSFEDRDPKALKNWLFRITRNRALNVLRKDKNAPLVITNYEARFEPAFGSRGDPLQQRQEFHEAMTWLGQLCDQQKQAVALVAFGFSHDEIAESYKTTILAVKARVNRGRTNMMDMRDDAREENKLDPKAVVN